MYNCNVNFRFCAELESSLDDIFEYIHDGCVDKFFYSYMTRMSPSGYGDFTRLDSRWSATPLKERVTVTLSLIHI